MLESGVQLWITVQNTGRRPFLLLQRHDKLRNALQSRGNLHKNLTSARAKADRMANQEGVNPISSLPNHSTQPQDVDTASASTTVTQHMHATSHTNRHQAPEVTQSRSPSPPATMAPSPQMPSNSSSWRATCTRTFSNSRINTLIASWLSESGHTIIMANVPSRGRPGRQVSGKTAMIGRYIIAIYSS